MHCRKAEHRDAEIIAAIAVCVWIDTYATEGVVSTISAYVLDEFTPKKSAELISGKHVYVAEHRDGAVVGYAVVSDEANGSKVQNIYVLPKFQACGVGTKLIGYITGHHKQLWLSCWSKNDKALRFYASRGFVKAGTTSFKLGAKKEGDARPLRSCSR